MVLLFKKGKYLLKFKECRCNGFPVIQQKQFSLYWSLWSWPMTYIPQNWKGSFTCEWQSFCEVCRLWVEWYSSYWVKTIFTLQFCVTLSFHLLISKTIEFSYSMTAIILWRSEALDKMAVKVLSRNHFHSSGPCNLDIWPTDPKNCKVLLLNRGNDPVKFEGCGSKGTQVTELKQNVTDRQTDGWGKTCLPQMWGDINYLTCLPFMDGCEHVWFYWQTMFNFY
jgi:hypothetical protein